MEFKSQICTSVEESKRLLALGLKKETVDMLIFFNTPITISCSWVRQFLIRRMILPPAWSLHRLVEMIPFTIWHTEHENSPRLEHTFWFSKYAPNYNSNEDIDFREHPNLYDNIIDCIEWLINEGYFNKDYLEEKK